MAKARADRAAASNVLPLLDRPTPPEALMPEGGLLPGVAFAPAPELADWIARAFLDEAGPLHSPEHAHLAEAHVACLWTNVENTRQGRHIVGQAEMPSRSNQGGKWQRARATTQLVQWFGSEPDFLLTFDALYCAEAADVDFCALVAHELCHCAQDVDQDGQPKFNRETGQPVFTIRGHDVEEFVSVVARFGAGADVQALIDAAAQPKIARASIAQACGTCQRRAA